MEQTHDKQMFIPNEWVTLTQGRYRIVGERCLGEGGQSAVWKAVREADGQTVVVRTVNLFDISNDRRDIRTDDEIHDLLRYAEEEITFLKKMGQVQSVGHFILPVLDDGFVSHPSFPALHLPTTVMPWYERGDLGQFVRSRRQRGTFTAMELLRWARQLATALVYIHQQHNEQAISVHRDIKPKNVVLDAQHNVGLTDFGIVRAAASLGTSSVVGSFTNCAPEQVLATHRSANRHKQYLITPAVDIYSLAITLHELVAGQTEAQKNLTLKTKDTNTLDEHDSYLPPSGTLSKGKIGKLGVIGGLTAQEQRHLHTQMLALLQPPNNSQTIALGRDKRVLPDAAVIADGMVELLVRMLAPWPADRPTAVVVLAAFTALEQCLTPTLEDFSLSLVQDQLTVGQTCTLRVSVKGSGLPADGRWLRFECNAQPLLGLQVVWVGEARHGLLPAEAVQSMEVVVPLPTETGDYRLKVVASVAGKTHSQDVVCHVTLTAAQWWGLGKHEEALRLELRPEWFETLLDQAKDLRKRNALDALLHRLQTHYAGNGAAQTRLEGMLVRVNEFAPPPEPPRPPPKLVWRKVALFGIGLPALGLGAFLLGNPKPQALLSTPVNPIPTAVTPVAVSPAPAVEVPAAVTPSPVAVEQPPPPEPTPAEQRQQAETWLQGSDKTQWPPAVKQLEGLADSGDAEASYILGGLYYAGMKGVKRSTQSGCEWYKKAAEANHNDAKATGKQLRCPGF